MKTYARMNLQWRKGLNDRACPTAGDQETGDRPLHADLSPNHASVLINVQRNQRRKCELSRRNRVVAVVVSGILSIIIFNIGIRRNAHYQKILLETQGGKVQLQNLLQYLNTSNLPPESVHRIAFVTFSYVREDDHSHLVRMLLPAVGTWAAPLDGDKFNGHNFSYPSLYVVFSDASRKPFEKACSDGSVDPSLCKRIEPIYVDCPEGRYGESPCCKQQKGLATLYNSKTQPLYDWYAFFDDDTYLRKEYLARILYKITPNPDLIPMTAIPYDQNAKGIGFEKHMCSSKDHADQFTYPWGMPVIYSQGALRIMERGYRANSLVLQCEAFNVTHDVGNAILNWMYSLPVTQIPPMPALPKMRDDFIGAHWAGRDEHAKNGGNFSFGATHKLYMNTQYIPPDINKLSTFARRDERYHRVTGFKETKTYGQYGDPQNWDDGVWHVMSVENCTV